MVGSPALPQAGDVVPNSSAHQTPAWPWGAQVDSVIIARVGQAGTTGYGGCRAGDSADRNEVDRSRTIS